ncbi:helix-turn-helix domain-containing protein [Nocardia flavorosea]|uniref:helix-turn-helix domain-containing protein n=1 Tax=Nocardia flavorosea TaxID=53429 RepID=UPI001895AFD0|nr:helix-turn-helix domain-containing protein [Nocardia flavorosea]MBF6351717.1 helix-turn-helix domain-containing protein [Nocardia flavorosea]
MHTTALIGQSIGVPEGISPAASIGLLLAGIVGGEIDDGDIAMEVENIGGGHRERLELRRVLGRLHGELSRLRRREHELTVLFASARELAESRDRDTVLTRLVSRAHEMMGSDVTYLSEFDPQTCELHVRKSVGAVTHGFQHLRVPPGMGLASGVVASRTAQWTHRYGDYACDPHDRAIDEAVAAEGIVSILGVPLLADRAVLGVLFAATRYEHVFTAEEIALLSALADHASVVVRTAEIRELLQESEQHTRQALTRLSERLRADDRANAVHQQLIQTVLVGGGFPDVARTMAGALGRTITIVDPELKTTAQSGSTPVPDGPLGYSATVRSALERSRTSGRCVLLPDTGSPVEAVAAITAGAGYFGALLLGHGKPALRPQDATTIERAAQVCALLTLQHNAADEAYRRTRAELVGDLLDTAPERRHDLERRLRYHGITLANLNTVVALVLPPEIRATAMRHLAARYPDGTLVAEIAGTIVVVTHSHTPLASGADIRTALIENLGTPVLAIVPPRSHDPEELPVAFEAALRTVRLLDALRVTDAVVDTAEYEIFSILFAHDPRGLHRFIAASIGPVLDYDAAHNTDLTATLRAFVGNGASPAKTARALGYHPNTILQRLDRIRALLGADWRSDQRLFRISTAVRLDELRHLNGRTHETGYGESPHQSLR